MERFTTLTGVAAPLMLRDVDTDVIIPMRGMLGGGDLARFAFEALRYGPEGADGPENPDFVLNRPAYRDAAILLAGENFGCGSSREPAVWAVRALGFRCVIAPSFGDIFFKNCFQNGVLPIALPLATVEALAAEAAEPGAEFAVDLETQRITAPSGRRLGFDVHPFRRAALLEGTDEIGLTLKRDAEIGAYQARDRERRPWVYDLRAAK